MELGYRRRPGPDSKERMPLERRNAHAGLAQRLARRCQGTESVTAVGTAANLGRFADGVSDPFLGKPPLLDHRSADESARRAPLCAEPFSYVLPGSPRASKPLSR